MGGYDLAAVRVWQTVLLWLLCRPLLGPSIFISVVSGPDASDEFENAALGVFAVRGK